MVVHVQVVGFHSGYHAMAIMATGAKLANGKRLAQVAGIRLALRDSVVRPDGEPGQVFMQLDGEPWVQKVPGGNAADHVVVSAWWLRGLVVVAVTTVSVGNTSVCLGGAFRQRGGGAW